MSLIKQTFTIGELENLTGIKAHTIRIWEKRYAILNPDRKSSNSRVYTNFDLQKLLNIKILLLKGHKISKIATYSDTVIEELINTVEDSISNKMIVLSKLRQSMMRYDESSFFEIISELRLQMSCKDVFKDYIITLLEEIGLLWQTNQISPTHEHFISNLVRMFIISETAKVVNNQDNFKNTFVLFTPIDEIHEIGLLFIQNQVKSLGFRCIYLGTHVPIESLKAIQKQYDHLVFLTYLTIHDDKSFYKLQNDLQQILENENVAWIVGKNIDRNASLNESKISLFNSTEEILNKIDQMIPLT